MQYFAMLFVLLHLLLAPVMGATLDRKAAQSWGPLVCGDYATADKKDADQLMRDFRQGSDDGHRVEAKAKTCHRLGCKNTSGFYMCNNSDSDVSVPASDYWHPFLEILHHCCYGKPLPASNGLSGSMTNDRGWKFIIAYANCNAGQDTDPSGYKGSNNSNCE